MSIEINIYGSDYSKVDYSEFSNENNKTSGVEFKGKPYNETIAQVITYKFLQKHGRNATKYIIGRNSLRTENNSISYYAYFNNEWWYQNVVGVLIDNKFSITTQDIQEFSSTYVYSTNEEIEAKFQEYLEQSYRVKMQIQTRFDGKNTYFLPTMLLKGKLELNDYTVPINMDNLFEFLLVHIYKILLEKAYTQGIYKTYQRFNNNDARFKGSLDVARHIKLNIGMNNSNIAYSYRENTTDNALNHLILHTYLHIKKYFPDLVDRFIEKDYEFKQKINDIQNRCPRFNETNVRMILGANHNRISHPFYLDYEALRQVCIKILNHMGVSVFDGTNEDEAQGILYYIPDLWESYLEDVMKKQWGERLKTQEKHKVFMVINDKTGKYSTGKHETYPDFIFYNDKETPIMVLDAKFKKYWGEAYERENIDLPDYTKCIRDMNTLNTHATGVIFPVSKKVTLEDEKIEHQISEFNEYDLFYSFPLIVPQSDVFDRYSSWKAEFEKNQEELLQIIKNKVNREMKRYSDREILYTKMQKNISQEEERLLRQLLGL